jgi:electron transport complex protein RnfD
VLLGATPGPVGATSAALLIVLGLYLFYRRLSSWRMAMAAMITVAALLPMMPVEHVDGLTVSSLSMVEMGWRVLVAYMSYQLLASPLLLIVLILAPATMPRSTAGRIIYGVILGLWFVTLRWFVPHENMAYGALVIAGLLAPLLDRMRASPFVAAARA